MPQTDGPIRVAVIGGGVAGLAAAYRLHQELLKARKPFKLVLYEQQPQCGGSARTTVDNEFVLEHGPNGWLSNEPLTARLIDELGLTFRLVTANAFAANRFIFTRKRLRQIPTTPGKFLTSRLLRPWEKLRVAAEWFIPGRTDDLDETIFDFGCRRLGRGFTETLLDPMVSGIFAGDIRQLSLPATFPKMREMELKYGGLFRAMLAKRREKKKHKSSSKRQNAGGPAGPVGVLTTLQGGTGVLTQTLARELEPFIRPASGVSSLGRQEDQWFVTSQGESQVFDAVVMAVPAYQASQITDGLDRELSQTLQAISFANVAVVCHAYSRDAIPRQLNGFGHLIPRRDGIRALGCLWTSSLFPRQSPPEKILLRTIFGGAHDPEILSLDDSELLELVREMTSTTLDLPSKPVQSWVFRHRKGIAQYTLGHRERVASIERFCKEHPSLAFVGASYRGVSLNRCIRDAYTIAPRVLIPWGIHADSLVTCPESAEDS